jgi:hypothetical protein
MRVVDMRMFLECGAVNGSEFVTWRNRRCGVAKTFVLDKSSSDDSSLVQAFASAWI